MKIDKFAIDLWQANIKLWVTELNLTKFVRKNYNPSSFKEEKEKTRNRNTDHVFCLDIIIYHFFFSLTLVFLNELLHLIPFYNLEIWLFV